MIRTWVQGSQSQRRSWTFGSGIARTLAAAAVIAAFSITAQAQAADQKPHKAAAKRVAKDSGDRPPASARPIYESIVVDATTGRVLHQVNADTRSYPASLTKMMTLYMLFDALQKNKVRLDTPMQVSAFAASQAPSKLDLAPGSHIAVEQAIYALVTKSANDVAVVIAEHLGGTEAKFGGMMTAKARSIGMTRSQFKNASGLPNKGQLSTARDMAILGKRLMTEFPQYFPYFSKTEFPFGGVMVRTHNHLLENYDGADGIKTGYTAASGFNLVASARRGNTRLITVVFGGASARARDQHVAQLMDAGFSVMTNKPESIAVAQKLDPFPATPEMAVSVNTSSGAATAAAFQSEDAAAMAAGDADDTIARQIVSEEAPPLITTAALVPAPGAVNAKPSKQAAKNAVAVAMPPAVKPAPTAKASSASWGIQIGAYANRTVAESHAADATAHVRGTFAAAAPRVTSIVQNKRTLYRAQVVGLTTQKDTAKACALVAKVAQAGCRSVAPDAAVASR